jgi:histidinol dehydrogenase
MLQIYKYPKEADIAHIIRRPSISKENMEEIVSPIVEAVKTRGDKALIEFALKFDHVALQNFAVSENDITNSSSNISEELKVAIHIAAKNIETFHARQKHDLEPEETTKGVWCWRKSIAIERVGLYIPGGTAPLFSTVLMLGIPARLAGCKEIILCTPPSMDGTIHPAVLFAAQISGITKVFAVGGAQAIAAMAFGTQQIPSVDKIFGPGNQYVTAAKQLVNSMGVAIDMPAGPSEVCIIADSSANPDFVAIDLLSQAEHGTDSHVLCMLTENDMLEKVIASLQKTMNLLPRESIVRKALSHSCIVVTEDITSALNIANAYAPEHLILALDHPEKYIPMITNAGSVFLGHFTPESAGDYASGTNHTLPTYGFARTYSGVSLDSFVKKVTFQKISRSGLEHLGKTIITMAESEALHAHALAVKLRLES